MSFRFFIKIAVIILLIRTTDSACGTLMNPERVILQPEDPIHIIKMPDLTQFINSTAQCYWLVQVPENHTVRWNLINYNQILGHCTEESPFLIFFSSVNERRWMTKTCVGSHSASGESLGHELLIKFVSPQNYQDSSTSDLKIPEEFGIVVKMDIEAQKESRIMWVQIILTTLAVIFAVIVLAFMIYWSLNQRRLYDVMASALRALVADPPLLRTPPVQTRPTVQEIVRIVQDEIRNTAVDFSPSDRTEPELRIIPSTEPGSEVFQSESSAPSVDPQQSESSERRTSGALPSSVSQFSRSEKMIGKTTPTPLTVPQPMRRTSSTQASISQRDTEEGEKGLAQRRDSGFPSSQGEPGTSGHSASAGLTVWSDASTRL